MELPMLELTHDTFDRLGHSCSFVVDRGGAARTPPSITAFRPGRQDRTCSAVCRKSREEVNTAVDFCLQLGSLDAFAFEPYSIYMPTGVYTRTPKPLPSPLPRFYRRVRQTEGCWEWLGARQAQGYGVFWHAGKNIPAHRFSLQQHIGRVLTATEFACHHCDNPSCVRPDHLFVGTQRANIHDAIQKQRFDPTRLKAARRVHGEQHGAHKLTEKQVREIRQDYQRGLAGTATTTSLRGLAKKYGVSHFAIRYVLQQGWTHVTCPTL